MVFPKCTIALFSAVLPSLYTQNRSWNARTVLLQGISVILPPAAFRAEQDLHSLPRQQYIDPSCLPDVGNAMIMFLLVCGVRTELVVCLMEALTYTLLHVYFKEDSESMSVCDVLDTTMPV